MIPNPIKSHSLVFFVPYIPFTKNIYILSFLNNIMSDNIASPYKLLINAVITPENDNNSPYTLYGIEPVEEAQCIDETWDIYDIDKSGENGDNDANKKRGLGFTKTNDVLVCKALITALEDTQTGAYQKVTAFKQKIYNCYARLLEEQE
jgi:hypothetical protein